jgi:hypothetical protein
MYMYATSLPRRPGRGIAVLAAAIAVAAFLCPADAASGELTNTADQPAATAPEPGGLQDVEQEALLARAQSLETLGNYLWTNNLSASRARLRAYELRKVASALVRDARLQLDRAETPDALAAASLRLEIVSSTSELLNVAADRISATRGERRRLRILALDLSHDAWVVFRHNELSLPEGEEVVPGQLFKEHLPAKVPSERAYLKPPARDYLTYKRGAVDTDVLERRFLAEVPRVVKPVPEEKVYYNQGALTLSPLDYSHRSLRIWWSPPPEELAWKVQEW